jgi:hypothetical protein
MSSERPSYDSLFSVASGCLAGNLVELASGAYLSAGRGQFRGLWTRDFCFAAGGLLELGRRDVVANHLGALLRCRRADGLVPRLMDSISPAWLRVAWHCAARVVPLVPRQGPMGDSIRPEYQSEHGVEAIDSNLLVLLASLDYVSRTGDTDWWQRHEGELVQVYRYYERWIRDGLVFQSAYSDWQDSVRRSGWTFYTNVLYHCVTERLLGYPAFELDAGRAGRLRGRIDAELFDRQAGLYRSVRGHPQISLDGVLLALDLGYVDLESRAAADLYRSLKTHALWLGHDAPGCATCPDYPRPWVSLPTRLVGLSGYHDRARWSWLMALSAKVALKMDDRDEAHRILSLLQEMADRDGAIYEIYFPHAPYLPWRSRWYESEAHFSWGAGCTIEAVAEARRAPTRAR